jgi:hypothetical protein
MRHEFLAKAAECDLIANHAARRRMRYGPHQQLAMELRKTVAHIDRLLAMYDELLAGADDCDLVANYAAEKGKRNTYQLLAKGLRKTAADIDRFAATTRQVAPRKHASHCPLAEIVPRDRHPARSSAMPADATSPS